MPKKAFSMVELIVVMAIVIAIASLSIPIVRQIRESSRRTTAKQTICQLVIGIQSYHDEDPFKRFPITNNNHSISRNIVDVLRDSYWFAAPTSGGEFLDPWGHTYKYTTIRDQTWWPNAPLCSVDANGNAPLNDEVVRGINHWNWSWDSSSQPLSWNDSVHLYGQPLHFNSITRQEPSYCYVWSYGKSPDSPYRDATYWIIP